MVQPCRLAAGLSAEESAASQTLLGIFAKYWQAGSVKTRLAATIGPAAAAEVARLFIATLLARFQGLADTRVVGFAPAGQQQRFGELTAGRWHLWPQPQGDLGWRMRAFFEWALNRAQRVVLVGCDAPDLPLAAVEAAFSALKTTPVVLGPAADGGYYLLGLAGRLPPIFEGIAWSTPAVWPQTIDRLREAKIDWHELPPWHDVDDEEGLEHLLARLNTTATQEPQLATLRDGLNALLGRRRLH